MISRKLFQKFRTIIIHFPGIPEYEISLNEPKSNKAPGIDGIKAKILKMIEKKQNKLFKLVSTKQ